MVKMYLGSQDNGASQAKKIEENLQKPKPADAVTSGQGLSSGGFRKDLSLEEKSKIFELSQKYASLR